ncbi:hypothetical protein HHI36_006354 [Cryptolaemus montrouzieri]|uniref:Cuticle protein n=1 Tax=Cryptolaemus montrouzieri TaxID=559131 RepID=A0ABD2NY97_9CUCU
MLASILVPPLVSSSAWNDPTSNQYHIQTDEGPERYFRYQTENGQYRKEKRLQDGTVIGTYAWIDGNGYLRQRDYIADSQGYRIVKNKNIYVGRNANIGDAIKTTKKISNTYGTASKPNSNTQFADRNYISVTPKPIFSISNIPPLVEVSLNSIPSSTPTPLIPELIPTSIGIEGRYQAPSSTLSPPFSTYSSVSTTIKPPTEYNLSSNPGNVYLPPASDISSSTLIPPIVSSTYDPPSPTYIPVSSTPKPPTVYIPPKSPTNNYIPPIVSSTYSPPSSTYISVSSTPKPPTIYIPPKNPTDIYIPSIQISTLPPIESHSIHSTYIPPTYSSTYLPPSSSYLPSSTPRPFQQSSSQGSVYTQSFTPPPVSYLPPSSPRPFHVSSTPSPIYLPSTTQSPLSPPDSAISSTPSNIYLPSSTPEYIGIGSPPRVYIPSSQSINSNSLEYSGSPQYEHYPEDFVNPYIHQNGPTYPIDTRGHSFNPSYNNIGNGYDPQYPYYDGISVTNDGFRYYIPKAYHEEQNNRHGEKTGSFGYIDPFGIRRVIYYNAGPDGFKHRKNNRYVGFNATPYDPRPY